MKKAYTGKMGWGNLSESTSFPVNSPFDVLEIIEKKPGLFLGNPTTSNLKSYIYGFLSAMDVFGITFTSDPEFFDEFSTYLYRELFETYQTTEGWDILLLRECDGDEDAALELFFEYLKRFKQQRAAQKEPSTPPHS